MSLHVFGAVTTANGIAANNRGPRDGNVSSLQKLIWNGRTHTSVSAESLRFAFRRRLVESGVRCNREFDEERNQTIWNDPDFHSWMSKNAADTYADDDLLGFMSAEAAREEAQETAGSASAKVRRSVLEVTRAISLAPWTGDLSYNAASAGAAPSAQRRGTHPVPYAVEIHATRYQFGFAITPGRLRVKERAELALTCLCSLQTVGGNHGRFLFDFSAESIIIRLTHDPAPRILYSFQATEEGSVGFADLLRRVKAGDVPARELIIGGSVLQSLSGTDRALLKEAVLSEGIVDATQRACARIRKEIS